MANLQIKYVKRYADRHGRVRYYFRRPGYPSATLPDLEDPSFLAAYAAANGRPKLGAGEKSHKSHRAKSFDALFDAYFASRDFTALAEHTQRSYRSNVSHFLTHFGTRDCTTFSRPALESYLDLRSDEPGAASNFLKRMKQVLNFGVQRQILTTNVARDVKFDKPKTDGFPAWTEDDVAAYEKRWPIGTKERLAFALFLYTGQRRSDVVRMGPQHVKKGRIEVTQAKGGKTLLIPLHPALKDMVKDLEGETFLLTEYGKPFTKAGFGSWFAERCEAAGVHKRAHGLRKAISRRLAEAGCTAYEIIAITGHSSAKEAEPYTRAVDQQRMADAAMKKVKNV